MTRQEIINKIKKETPSYFARGEMRFFGQKMSMFKKATVSGIDFIYAPSYWENKLMGYSIVGVIEGKLYFTSLGASKINKNLNFKLELLNSLNEEYNFVKNC